MECDIDLSIRPVNPELAEVIPHLPVGAGHFPLPDALWAYLERSGGVHWNSLLGLSQNKSRPCLQGWSLDGEQGLTLNLFAGDDAFEMATPLIHLMRRPGCLEVRAVVYTDEAECIEDDAGVIHRIGWSVAIDEYGRLSEGDYPEVEYEYYD